MLLSQEIPKLKIGFQGTPTPALNLALASVGAVAGPWPGQVVVYAPENTYVYEVLGLKPAPCRAVPYYLVAQLEFLTAFRYTCE